MWNEISDRYFLKVLNVGLNKIPACSKPVDDLTEKECEVWIKKPVLATSIEVLNKSYEVNIPEVKREFPLAGKSDYLMYFILSLSLENNSTLREELHPYWSSSARSFKFHANMQAGTLC